MLKGVIYARYSSDNQREESIDAQVYEIKEYAKANNIAIIKVYTDEARSATTDNRPGFLNMVADAKNGIFDVVIVHKLDRFARNRYDSAFYKRELRLAGVKLLSITEKLDDSPESVILESVIEGMAEYYSKNLAREAMKGLKENARSCKHNGGRPPLGLDVEPTTKQYVPSANQKEIDAVKMIFEMFDDGKGYGQIISECNLRGYATKVGKQFAKNGLHEILRNEKYIGTYVYNRSASKDTMGKRNNHQCKSEEDIIRVEDAFPAIIDKELFRRVQAKMDENKRQSAKYKAKVNYLLAGLIYCGECGAALVGNSGSYKTKDGQVRYSYYECNKRDRQSNCDNPRTRKEILEDRVLDKLALEFFHPERISKLVKGINQHIRGRSTEINDELNYYKTELAETKKQMDNLVMAIANGAPFEPLSAKIKELETKKAELESRIIGVEVLSTRELITEDMIKEYLDQHRKAVEEKDIDKCKKFIHNFVEKVIVDKDNITVHFYFNAFGYDGGGGAYRSISKIPKKKNKQEPVGLQPYRFTTF
jgi:site-specific DNA recombinase